MLIGIGAGAAFLLSQSQVMAVDEIVIDGNHIVASDAILEKAGPLLRGQSIVRPPFDSVTSELAGFSYIEGVDFERDYPNTIVIHIRERRPFVCLQTPAGKSYVIASDGMVLTELDGSAAGGAAGGLTLLNTREPCDLQAGTYAGCDDVMTGIRFLANIPVSFNYEFAEITVDKGDIRARTKTGVGVHFGSLDDYGLKFEVLRQLLARSTTSGVQVTIDVTVPERPVTKEDAPPPPAATTTAETAVEEEAPAEEVPVEEPAAALQETPAAADPTAAIDPAAAGQAAGQ